MYAVSGKLRSLEKVLSATFFLIRVIVENTSRMPSHDLRIDVGTSSFRSSVAICKRSKLLDFFRCGTLSTINNFDVASIHSERNDVVSVLNGNDSFELQRSSRRPFDNTSPDGPVICVQVIDCDYYCCDCARALIKVRMACVVNKQGKELT